MKFLRAADQSFVPASHEDPLRPGVYKRVIRTREEFLPGHVQMINWAKLPVDSAFRSHYHEDMEETFILISGECQMQVDGRVFELKAGDTLVVSPREVHSMQNTGSSEVEYLVVGVSLGQNGRTVVVDSKTE